MKKIAAIMLSFAIILSLLPHAVAAEEIVYYVSPGASSGDGSLENPFGSLETAKKAASASKGKGSVTVILRGGDYYLKNSLEFTDSDSGGEEAPITYKAYEGEKPVIKGNVEIAKKNIKKVTDEKLLARMSSNAKGSIYEITLTSDAANNVGNTFLWPIGAYDAHIEFNTLDVFYNDRLMQMSCYPNSGFISVEGMDEPSDSDMFSSTFSQEDVSHFSSWTDLSNAVFSYFTRAGYEQYYMPIEAVSQKDRTVTFLKENASTGSSSLARMGPSAQARVRFLNLLEEIDMPGEWSLDKKNKKIYFYPEDDGFSGTFSISLTNTPLILFKGAKNISFEGIGIGYCRNDAVRISEQSSGITFSGCDIMNSGGSGVNFNDSKKCTVKNCSVFSTGLPGIYVDSCGKTTDITESGIIITNNDIFDFSRFTRGVGGGITLKNSCGIEVTHNRVHFGPSQGIEIGTCVLVKVDNNEVYDCVREMIDAGGIYVNGRGTDWGIEFTNNFVHDITNKLQGRGSTHGLYADAQHHNVTMDNNVFFNVTSGTAFQNGGSYGSIANNVFVDCPYPVIVNNYTKMLNWLTIAREPQIAKVNKEKYLERFPLMADWLNKDTDETSRRWCVGFSFHSNVSVAKKGGTISDSLVFESMEKYGKKIGKNYSTQDYSVFGFDENSANFGTQLKIPDDAAIYKEVPDFQPIDFDAIGLEKEKMLGAVIPVSPQNGAENILGNNAVFSWHGDKGCYKYRLIVALDENFDAVVADEIVTDTQKTISTLKYGKRKYFWKVIPVPYSKNDILSDEAPQVFSFTTAQNEAVDKTALKNIVNLLGNNYSSFYTDSELVEETTAALAKAKDVLNNKKAKQTNVRTQTKKLSALSTRLYDSVITNTYVIDDYLDDYENWIASDAKGINDEYKQPGDGYIRIINQVATGKVLSYAGQLISPGETVKCTFKMNPTNYQGLGFSKATTGRLWTEAGYYLVLRLGYIELQRYNYNAQGELEGDTIQYFPSRGRLAANMWMLMETGYMRVHNGTRVVLKVNGDTLVDYVDTSALAFSDSSYFRIENGSSEQFLYVGSVNNDTSQAVVTGEE